MDDEAEPQIEIEPPAAGERGLLPGMRTMHIKGVDQSSDDEGDGEADGGATENRNERRIKLGE
jgi:hypothetical protein